MESVRVVYAVLGIVAAFGGLMQLVSTGEGHLGRGLLALLLGAVMLLAAMMAGEVKRLGERVRQLEQREPPRHTERAFPFATARPAIPEALRDSEAAKALLRAAQDHHFAKQFAEARQRYTDLVTQFPDTKQATVARQQLENLRNV
jgi:TolA-binding protein